MHVPTETLVRINPQWAGPLLGDKAWSTVFDNSKLRGAIGDFECRIELEEGMRLAAPYVKRQVSAVAQDAGCNHRFFLLDVRTSKAKTHPWAHRADGC